MKTKVSVCGMQNCAFCADNGQCVVGSIGIDKKGQCINYFKRNDKLITHYPTADEDPPSLR